MENDDPKAVADRELNKAIYQGNLAYNGGALHAFGTNGYTTISSDYFADNQAEPSSGSGGAGRGVTATRTAPGFLFQSIDIAPSVDFARLEEVFVILSVPDSSRTILERPFSE